MNKIFLRSGEYTIEELDDIVEKFPNGITSYLETYYEIVNGITNSLNLSGNKANLTAESQGIGELYELAESLTDKFELQNKDRKWDGEFYDTIDKYLKKELYEKV